MTMDGIGQKAPSPLFDFGASTSSASDVGHEPAPSCIRKSSRKRKYLIPPECLQTYLVEETVQKRNVKSTEQSGALEKHKGCTQELGIREKLKAEALARGCSNAHIKKFERKWAVKEIEQWLRDQGVDTEELKKDNTETDKYSQYEEKLQFYITKGNPVAIFCQDALDELAKVFCDFEIMPNKSENIKKLSKLIAQTEKLKKRITVDTETYEQLIRLRAKVGKQVRENNDEKRNRDYAASLFIKASTGFEIEVGSGIHESLMLVGGLAGLISRPIKMDGSNKWRDDKNNKIKLASLKLKTILEEKYNIEVEADSIFRMTHVAKDVIQKLKKHEAVYPKKYINNYFEKFDGRVDKAKNKKVANPKQGCVKPLQGGGDFRGKINKEVLELQGCMQISILNRCGNPDIERTLLKAYDFFDEYELVNPTPAPTEDAVTETEEEIASRAITVSESDYSKLTSSDEEFSCSSGSVSKTGEKQIYAELEEVLKQKLTFLPPPANISGLICAAEYYVYTREWQEPATKPAYRRFRYSQMGDRSLDSTHQEFDGELLNSLKKRLKSVSLRSDKIDELQGVEIIRAVISYCNSM